MATRGRRVKPAGGYELWWWYFMRISGLVLVFLAMGHLTIMHILYNVEVINYAWVANRWAHPTLGPFWRLWDGTMLVLAVLHGFNGIRQITWEYATRPGTRKALATVIWGLCIFIIAIGTYAIVLFVPDKGYLRRFYDANPSLSREMSVVPLDEASADPQPPTSPTSAPTPTPEVASQP